jgi:thiamine biosynthesis protein ThiS
MISIVLNGEPRQLAAGVALSRLLDELRLDSRLVAVEHNGRIVARQGLAGVVLRDGDRVEVVHFVQGGI